MRDIAGGLGMGWSGAGRSGWVDKGARYGVVGDGSADHACDIMAA